MSAYASTEYSRHNGLLVKDILAVWHEADAAISRLAFIEADVGMTFAGAAIQAQSTGECLHYRRLSRQAYDSASRLIERIRLTEPEAKVFSAKIGRLKLALIDLGDPLLHKQLSADQDKLRDYSVFDSVA